MRSRRVFTVHTHFLHRTVLSILIVTIGSHNTCAQPKPEWVRSLSPSQPGPYTPAKHPALSEFDFGWAFLHAGTGKARVLPSSASQIQMEAEAHTTGPVRSLFRIDAHFQSVASLLSLHPVRVQQTERYSDEAIETTLLFDSQGVVRRRFSIPNPKPGTGKPKQFHFSPLFDPFSAYLWLRSQPHRNGDVYRIVLYASADPYLLQARTIQRESIPIGTLNTNAIRIDLSFFSLDRSLQTLPYKKCRSASLWISESPKRQLLRAEADIFVGKIWVQIQPESLKEPP